MRKVEELRCGAEFGEGRGNEQPKDRRQR